MQAVALTKLDAQYPSQILQANGRWQRDLLHDNGHPSSSLSLALGVARCTASYYRLYPVAVLAAWLRCSSIHSSRYHRCSACAHSLTSLWHALTSFTIPSLAALPSSLHSFPSIRTGTAHTTHARSHSSRTLLQPPPSILVPCFPVTSQHPFSFPRESILLRIIQPAPNLSFSEERVPSFGLCSRHDARRSVTSWSITDTSRRSGVAVILPRRP